MSVKSTVASTLSGLAPFNSPVKNSSISHNLGHGYWSDVSVYDTKLVNSNFVKNSATGIFLEISARGTVVNNLIDGNGAEGIKINNTSTVLIYNNTVLRKANTTHITGTATSPAGIYTVDVTR